MNEYLGQDFEVKNMANDTLDIRNFIKKVTSNDPSNHLGHVLKQSYIEGKNVEILFKIFETKLNEYEEFQQSREIQFELQSNVYNEKQISELSYQAQYLYEIAIQKGINFMIDNKDDLKKLIKSREDGLEAEWKKNAEKNYRSQELNMNVIPSLNISIPVNKENVLKHGIVSEKKSKEILDEILIDLNPEDPNETVIITKNRLIMLDIIAENDWERPIYFSGGAFNNEDYIWMKDYLQLDGMVYKLVPIKTPAEDKYTFGMVDTEKMMRKLEKWKWGYENPSEIYLDDQSRKNSISYRGYFSKLIE